MPEIIQVDDKTRIRRMDRMNWTVESLRPVKKRDGTTAVEWAMPKGVNYGPFFHKPEHALSWMLNEKHMQTDGTLTLEQAVAEYREIAAKFAADVESAVGTDE